MKVRRAVGALFVVIALAIGVAAVSGEIGSRREQPTSLAVGGARVEGTISRVDEPTRQGGNKDRDQPRVTPTTRQTQSPATTAPELPGPTTTPTTAPPTTAPATTAPPPTTTQPLPTPDGERFIVALRGLVEGADDLFWWDASYVRELSYGLDTGWVDGDRDGYKCLYAFLTLDGQAVGRVTFWRVEGAASYAAVKDSKMMEGVRYYNGAVAPANAPKELGDCPASNASYQPYHGPDQRPSVTYSTPAGQLLEIRNYKNVVPGNGITFQQVEESPGRVVVVAYEWGNPVIVVYYESISPQVVMASDM